MASIKQVQDALGVLVASAVYPDGINSPSVVGVEVLVVSGWPLKDTLNQLMAANKPLVSIFKVPGMDRNTSRFPRQWQAVSINAATLTAAVAGQTLTIGGTVSTPQSVMAIVDNQSYAYLAQVGDTLNSIAANLGAMIPGATILNNTITVTGAHSFIGRIGVAGVSGKEVKRQQSVYSMITWAPTPEMRDTLSEAIDVVFAEADFLSLPDGFPARIIWQGIRELDNSQDDSIFRRDLTYMVEYPTVKTETQYTITHPYVNSITVNP